MSYRKISRRSLIGMWGALIWNNAIATPVIDGMSVSISELDFKTSRPEAKMFYIDSKNPSHMDYMYVLKKPYSFEESNVVTSMRAFENGKGCGVSMGLAPKSESEVTSFIARVETRHGKPTITKKMRDETETRYFEDQGYFISLTRFFGKDGKPSELAYLMTSKVCSKALATRWQSAPR